ncbi:MAG: hypothetical protein ABW252_17430 [Polyangiales bacterium]
MVVIIENRSPEKLMASLPHRRTSLAASLLACTVACADPVPDDVPSPPRAQLADAGTRDCPTFESSYDAIQQVIFERKGCTAQACHGAAAVGGLDLRAGASYAALVDAPSTVSRLTRVNPGTVGSSFLFHKLQAATAPGSVQIAGSPMPVGTAPLTERELEAVKMWIKGGAPETGSVRDPLTGVDVGALLDACVPPSAPVKPKPLEPPAADEGVQFVLPSYVLKANSEVDVCTPFAYDFTDVVPARFKDASRNVMFVNGAQVRQDPQSHHLIFMQAPAGVKVAPDDPSWTCRGGARAGALCDASHGSADCGAGGVCAGKTIPGQLCDGFDASALGSGTPGEIQEAIRTGKLKPEDIARLAGSEMPVQLINAQSPQQTLAPLEGVYAEIPLKGIFYWNSHAFNLTDQETPLNGRINYRFALPEGRRLKYGSERNFNNIAHGQPPFTRRDYCAKHVVPQHHSLAMMTGHTHRRGERFWVKDPTGKLIYENFDYNDPAFTHYTPWLEFPSANPAERTLEFCATYNNGLNADGTPNLDLVTRASRMPERTSCKPVACVAGKVTAACTTDRDCDSTPGRGDGACDACAIVAGQTTENEMFVLMPYYVQPPNVR